ncbi:hypothetical protein NXT3_PA00037 (plasmid) [Sinorhizobium fredii]|uniref:Uncharacterized protein n=1 Tax=Rhizobium fredii TaxID=380 RepID=A0A2L0HA25_RHIFR|nr:hypothetical protein NXT3_PA00037 [Sinorhizobium fredii]
MAPPCSRRQERLVLGEPGTRRAPRTISELSDERVVFASGTKIAASVSEVPDLPRVISSRLD